MDGKEITITITNYKESFGEKTILLQKINDDNDDEDGMQKMMNEY
jgi:hypothetical protein